jgi:hypothetical protein
MEGPEVGGWMKVTLEPGNVTGAMFLQEAFGANLATAGFPKSAAMFRAVRPVQNAYYFSPGAVTIARYLLESNFTAKNARYPLGLMWGLQWGLMAH